MTVLVAGASGTTGSLVVDQLVAAGVDVRAMTRSPDKVEDLQRPGVEPVVAHFDDPDALDAALTGVRSAYVATPAAPDMAATEGAFARSAARQGVHVVKLSVVGADPDGPIRFARMHAESEAAVEAALDAEGATWTFVRPNGFMQNDLAWAAQVPSGSVAGPVMDAAWSVVDARDVAAVAVAALTDPVAHAGRRHVVTGPAARTPRERVAALATALGRDLEAVDVPVEAAVEQLRGWGVPDWTAEGLGELYRMYADGFAADVSREAAEVLDRPLRSWEDFVADHEDAYRG